VSRSLRPGVRIFVRRPERSALATPAPLILVLQVGGCVYGVARPVERIERSRVAQLVEAVASDVELPRSVVPREVVLVEAQLVPPSSTPPLS